jgi:hypothetical protein
MIYRNNLYGEHTLLYTSPDVDDPDVPTVVISNLMIQNDKTNVYTKDQCDEKFALKNTSGAVTDDMDELWVKTLYFGMHGNSDWRFVNTYDFNEDENTLTLVRGGGNVMTFTRKDSAPIVRFEANVQLHSDSMSRYLWFDTINEPAIYLHSNDQDIVVFQPDIYQDNVFVGIPDIQINGNQSNVYTKAQADAKFITNSLISQDADNNIHFNASTVRFHLMDDSSYWWIDTINELSLHYYMGWNDTDVRIFETQAQADGSLVLSIPYLHINGGQYSNVYTKAECDAKFMLALPDAGAGSHTITHITNIINLEDVQAPERIDSLEIIEESDESGRVSNATSGDISVSIKVYGVFCETNGGIYTGYERIGPTDCICQVQPSKAMSNKIVGIIVSETQFASHGDVLCKVIPGVYALGDILAPDESGLCRKATEEEKLMMMINGIPRPKVTSFITGIDNIVACFIV